MAGLLKDMPKNEGGTPEKKKYKDSTPAKMEGVEVPPPTYAELGITYKDAARWEKAALTTVQSIPAIRFLYLSASLTPWWPVVPCPNSLLSGAYYIGIFLVAVLVAVRWRFWWRLCILFNHTQ